MAWEDPIVEEVRRIRDAYAKKFNYDLDAIFRDLRGSPETLKRQRRSEIHAGQKERVGAASGAGG